jgi:hypothetical protein
MKIRIARPSPALVIAMIALFVSLGGSALAVSGGGDQGRGEPTAQPALASSRSASASSWTGTRRRSTARSTLRSATQSARKEKE